MKPSPKFFIPVLFVFLVSFTIRSNNDPRKDVLKYTNQFRQSKHLSGLIMSEELNEIAEKHSRNMATGRVPFGHAGFSQRSALIGKKLKLWSVAENVAFGVSNGRDAVQLWQTSPGHRMNMLGNYKYVGVGTAVDRKGQTYFTQIFAR